MGLPLELAFVGAVEDETEGRPGYCTDPNGAYQQQRPKYFQCLSALDDCCMCHLCLVLIARRQRRFGRRPLVEFPNNSPPQAPSISMILSLFPHIDLNSSNSTRSINSFLGLQATCASPWGLCPSFLLQKPPMSSYSRHQHKVSSYVPSNVSKMIYRGLAG
jgi:hypothetical protein